MPGRVAPQDVAQVRLGDAIGRQVEDRRRVGGHLEQRPQVAELEAAVDQHRALLELTEGNGEVEREVVLPTPPLGANTDTTREPPWSAFAAKSLRTWATRVMSSNPENGIDSTPWMPASGSGLIGVWGTVRTMTGTPSFESRICSTSWGP